MAHVCQHYDKRVHVCMRLCDAARQAAADAGFTSIHITPHLDSGDGGDWTIRSWRNVSVCECVCVCVCLTCTRDGYVACSASAIHCDPCKARP